MDSASAEVSPAYSSVLTAGTRVRRAERKDQQAIAGLLYFELHVHRHLDWRMPLDWLGVPEFWVAERGEHLLAALACPPDPPQVAWLRLFTYRQTDAFQAWDIFWETVQQQMLQNGCLHLACIAQQDWMESLLQARAFNHLQDIVLLEWTADVPPSIFPLPPGLRLRSMQPDDLPSAAAVDAAAFAPLWQNSLGALQNAYPQAVFATLIESETGVLGYQISTQSGSRVHLARLAVRPEAQGRGIGSTLTADLIQRAFAQGTNRISVNTQSDNQASLHLYAKLGFRPTGQHYPVYVFDFPAHGKR